MLPHFHQNQTHSDKTSLVEGKELGELKRLWSDTASSEQRLKLMSELKKRKIGFNEVEMFSLGLKYDLKSEKLRHPSKNPTLKVVEAAMELKMRDEAQNHRELTKRKEKMRRWLKKIHQYKIHQYKTVIRDLRREAEKTTAIQKEKYWKKLKHLEDKYQEEEKGIEIPTGMEKLSHLKVFRDTEFENIEEDKVEVAIIGVILLSEEEKLLLKRTPKFAIPEPLQEHSLKEEMEKAYSKLRMELRDEEVEDEELNPELVAPVIKSQEETDKETERAENEAKSRQIYDPVEKRYDDRNRRVTDLPECSRVTLPRPLNIIREAQIENRRDIHNNIYQQYRKEFCGQKGDQESGLSKEEEKGLESLRKRIEKEEIVVMKTDKSGKFSITSRDKYLEMGEVHVGKDAEVDREKIRETDKIMNEHSRAWISIWKTGANHGQEDRILASKTNKSENTAKLYLAYKDHKTEPGKTRPIGTANTSNTRGFANAVSDLLEAVANSITNSHEVISSEDMLHHANNHNKKIEKEEEKSKITKLKKINCKKCKVWSLLCLDHQGENNPTNNPTKSPPESEELTCIDKEKEVKEILDTILDIVASCTVCMNLRDEKIRTDCEDCGGAYQKQEKWVLIGMDAVSLFPSLSASNTGKIVKRRVENCEMEIESFNWKKAILYIKINSGLISSKISKETRSYFPLRKSRTGVEPGMPSKGLSREENSENMQWMYPRRNPSKAVMKEMMGLVSEVAINILWTNYCYSFGGKTRIQKEGGPIGQRPTMAASRLVTMEFMENYERILLKSEIKVNLLKMYVDDGRQISTKFRKGMRYCAEKERFVWSKKDEVEDEKKEKEGEKEDAFMARLCLEAMNKINPDLTFTAEVASDFKDGRLPTLDFSLWMKEDMRVSHSYYEKNMKSQRVVEKNSAMGNKQKYCILGNETTRRLYNVAEENEDPEVEIVLENITKQLKNSGWEKKDVVEILTSGYKGWKRRLVRRLEEGGEPYRSAANSLASRSRKKLTGKVDWYKTNKKRKRDEEDEQKLPQKKRKGDGEHDHEDAKVASVMFVPFTPGGELVKRLKVAEQELAKQTGIKIKMVEKAGIKLVDILHKSDPWQGQDCGREKCLLCKTKMKTGKQKTQECTKRSIVYETWCLTCETRELEKAMEEESDEKKVKERICKAPKFKYIGETARSAYERGLEHQRDFEDMKLDSHILKHYLDNHKDDKMEDLEFGMRIVRNARSAFERQIAESVIIQSEKKNHFILNSKSEYNRCALPRLTAKVGNFTIDELERKKKDEKEREKELMSKIRALKVEKSKIRREEVSRIQMPAEKKRKISKETHKKVLKIDPTATKRKETMEETTKTTRHTKYKTNNNNKKQKTQHNTNNIKEESTDHLLELYGIKKREPTIEIPETTEPKETETERNERLKAEWDEKLRKREEVIRKEELERKERKEKSEKMSRSWDLLNLCREIMSKEGYNWKVSKERRDLEREEKVEKEDRLQKARNRKDLTLEKLKKKEKQLKITTELRKIPENRRKILLLEIEKERILTLKEAKEELWSKHSQRKGRGLKKKTKLEEEKMSLERKLDIIEKEAKKYEEELEKEMIEIQDKIEEKENRLNKQKRKKKHYEMLRWTVNFIEENKQVWEDEKKRRQKENEEEERNSEWKKLNKEEKINLMKVEEAKEKDINERNPENSKTERLKTVITDKEKWKTWREKEEKETILKKLDPAEQEQRCDGTLDPDEQAKLSRGTLDPAEQDLEYDHDFDLEGEGTFCTNCAYTPCICHLVKLQLKIKILNEIKKVENQAIQDIQSLNQKGESLSLNQNKHSSPDPNNLSLDIKESKNYSEKNKIQDKQSLNQKQESSSLNRNKYSSLDQDFSSLDRKHKASGLDQEDPSLGQEQEVSRPSQGSSFWILEQEGETVSEIGIITNDPSQSVILK